MCQYQFIVCLPLLCPPSDVNIGDESQASLQRKAHEIPTAGLQQALQTLKARAKPKTILDVMEVLISKCHVRLEEWWTYELCFNTGIRQFHMQAMSVADNAGKPAATQMKVTGEFSLGTAPFSVLRSLSALEAAVVGTGPERPGETNGKLTRPAGLPSSVLQRKYKPKTLVLSYEGGTPCDIENIQRASVVEVTCSPNGADSIVDIIEDRTCHYLIKVHSALLCELDGFKRPREKATMLSFIPDTQEVSARFKLQEALGVDLAREYGDKMRQESWLRNERMAAEAASSRNRRNIEKNEEKRGRNLAKELPPLPNPRGLHLE
jgi:hypothetical protein